MAVRERAEVGAGSIFLWCSPALTQCHCPQHLLLSCFLLAHPVASCQHVPAATQVDEHRAGRPHVNFLWGTDVTESKPGHPWSRRDLGFQCPGEAGSAGDMDIMRKESIVPPQPDQILILPFSSYRFSPPRQPSGWELLLAAPPRVFWEGRGTEGPGPSLGTVRTRISHLLKWLGGCSGGEGSFGHPLLPKASSTIPFLTPLRELTLEEIYGLALPGKCPPLCYDSTPCLRFDIKSRECKGSSWLSSVLEWHLISKSSH